MMVDQPVYFRPLDAQYLAVQIDLHRLLGHAADCTGMVIEIIVLAHDQQIRGRFRLAKPGPLSGDRRVLGLEADLLDILVGDFQCEPAGQDDLRAAFARGIGNPAQQRAVDQFDPDRRLLGRGLLRILHRHRGQLAPGQRGAALGRLDGDLLGGDRQQRPRQRCSREHLYFHNRRLRWRLRGSER